MMPTPDRHQSTPLHELSTLVFSILRAPPSSGRRRTAAPPPQMTPAGMASLMLGISLALMLCGSVTFFIGFMLLPWVIGLVMVFYFVGLISSVSLLARAFLCYAHAATAPPPCPSSSSPSSPTKDIPAWKFL